LRLTDLRALRDKYERMLRLRELHARAKAQPAFTEPDPRGPMADLARSYPGALREIDELPIVVIRARIADLTAAENDASRITMWMTAQSRFHALARGALATKRWLEGRPLTPELRREFEGWVRTLPDGEDVQLWDGELASIAAPPRGRLMTLVFARLARELGVEVATARAAVLPPRASLRGRRA
jgi:hypothetical protein